MKTARLLHFTDVKDEINEYWKTGLSTGFSTGWQSVDKLFKVQKGSLNIVTGIPSSGKSEILDQLMLHTIALHTWHWTVFSPENYPLPFHFQKLAEKWMGKPWRNYDNREPMTKGEVSEAMLDLSGCISLVEPSEDDYTIEAILQLCRESVERNNTDAVLIDPYNEIEHNRPAAMSETEYIGKFLTKLRNFARVHNVTVFLVAHPAKLKKREDGKYPVPTPYDISGSANFRNKADACLAAWRDYELNDGVVELYVQKIRNKNIGTLGSIKLYWDRPTGLFLEEEWGNAKPIKGMGMK